MRLLASEFSLCALFGSSPPLAVASPTDWVLKALRVNGLSQYALGY
jgi:hypothetical protein